MHVRAGFLVVLAACVPMQQTQSTPTEPQAAAQPAQGQATCPMVVDCYARCADETCVRGCEAGVDPSIVTPSRAFALCSYQHQCTEATCQQQNCANEISTCLAAGGGAPVATGQAPGTPAAPTNAGAPPVAPSNARLLMGLRMTGTGSSYMGGVGWYVLFDDGRVLARLPSEGLEGINENAFASELGTYRMQGDTMDMLFQQYNPVFQKRSDGSWTSREGTFWPAQPLDGARLDGAYAPKSGPPDIAFTADGRFQSNGGLLIFTGVNGVQPTPAGQGTYRIAQNTLTLMYQTGQVVRISVSTLKAEELPRPSAIYFGGYEYHRP